MPTFRSPFGPYIPTPFGEPLAPVVVPPAVVVPRQQQRAIVTAPSPTTQSSAPKRTPYVKATPSAEWVTTPLDLNRAALASPMAGAAAYGSETPPAAQKWFQKFAPIAQQLAQTLGQYQGAAPMARFDAPTGLLASEANAIRQQQLAQFTAESQAASAAADAQYRRAMADYYQQSLGLQQRKFEEAELPQSRAQLRAADVAATTAEQTMGENIAQERLATQSAATQNQLGNLNLATAPALAAEALRGSQLRNESAANENSTYFERFQLEKDKHAAMLAAQAQGARNDAERLGLQKLTLQLGLDNQAYEAAREAGRLQDAQNGEMADLMVGRVFGAANEGDAASKATVANGSFKFVPDIMTKARQISKMKDPATGNLVHMHPSLERYLQASSGGKEMSLFPQSESGPQLQPIQAATAMVGMAAQTEDAKVIAEANDILMRMITTVQPDMTIIETPAGKTLRNDTTGAEVTIVNSEELAVTRQQADRLRRIADQLQ